MNKLDFANKMWDTSDNQRLRTLILNFELQPDVESDVFQQITDLIWEEGTCYPMFFVIVPYLVEIASKLRIEDAKDLWSYLGCWISTHEKYRGEVSNEVLEYFDSSLRYAEEACIEQLMSVEQLDETDAQYLYASLFAFAKHRMGYMTMSTYKDDFEGISIAECSKGHVNDVSVYNSGIVPYEEKENPRKLVMPVEIKIDYETDKNNKWILFKEKLQRQIDNENTKKEIKAHLELAKEIINQGVTSQLIMKYAFSLYGSLLYCNGSYDASMRVFHGWDEMTCAECGEKFVFADGWCEDKY